VSGRRRVRQVRRGMMEVLQDGNRENPAGEVVQTATPRPPGGPYGDAPGALYPTPMPQWKARDYVALVLV